MDSSECQNLDTEYKHYLEIMRPYVGQLLDQEAIQICKSWIRRLSNCSETEKVLRNKYVFSLCYQLAKGVLEEPFINSPTSKETPLSPLPEDTCSDESTEVECLVLDLENTDAKILYNNQNNTYPGTGNFSLNCEFLTKTTKNESVTESNKSIISRQCDEPEYTQNLVCYNCPKVEAKYNTHESIYHYRTNNLIQKLREIKKQNLLLHRELQTLKDESRPRNLFGDSRDDILKVDDATSTYLQCQDSTTTLQSLKEKLHEAQENKNSLIERIGNLQDKLDNIIEINDHEKENLEANHKLEIIRIKTALREEAKTNNESTIAGIRRQYDEFIKNIKEENIKELEKIEKAKESIISEKNNIIKDKDIEINGLLARIQDLQNNQISMLKKVLENPQEETDTNHLKNKTDELTKRLTRIEKSKLRSSRAYEAKISNLQREKHLAECSLQLQLLKQRAQLVGEYAEEHQNELTVSVDKLENKYKEIIANVQATAVQRRIRDQTALESIIRAVCGIRNEGAYVNSTQTTFPSRLPGESKRDQTRDGGNESPSACRSGRVGSVIVGNKSYLEDSSPSGYDLDNEKLGVFFERVHIPQRDTGEDSTEK